MEKEKQMIIKVCNECSGTGYINKEKCINCNAKGKIKVVPFVPYSGKNKLTKNVNL